MRMLCTRAFPLLAAAVVVSHPAGATGGEGVPVEIRLADKGVARKCILQGIPGAARKLFARYQVLASSQAPLVLATGGIKSKGVVWFVCKNVKDDALVFITQNKSDESVSLPFAVNGRMPLAPTYRRVYSEDQGKNWTSMAFEPPHSSSGPMNEQAMRSPCSIEIPPRSYQTVTIRLI